MINKDNKKMLKKLLNYEKEKEYINNFRDRWDDQSVLDVYYYARKLEKDRISRKAKRWKKLITIRS